VTAPARPASDRLQALRVGLLLVFAGMAVAGGVRGAWSFSALMVAGVVAVGVALARRESPTSEQLEHVRARAVGGAVGLVVALVGISLWALLAD
jgi:hypothetical protein